MLRLALVKTRGNANSVAALLGAVAPRGGWRCLSVTEEEALSLPPDMTTVVGLGFTTFSRPWARDLAARLRRRFAGGPGLVLVAGGAHPSGAPDDTLSLGFDTVVVGEGERSLAAVMADVEEGRQPPALLRAAGPPLDLDALSSFAPDLGLFAPIELGRGCPHRCLYCQTPAIHGGIMRQRSLEAALAHVDTALRHGKRRTWFLIPDAFAWGSPGGAGPADPVLCERLLRGCRERGMEQVFWGSFPGEVRPEHVSGPLLDLVLRHCANRVVVIGAQSGSDRVLARVRRGHDAAAVRRAASLIHGAGLTPIVDFIVGLPGEERADREATFRLVDELVEGAGARIRFHSFMPLPGTALAGATPAPVEDEFLERMRVLTGRGHAEGYWSRQRLGRKVREDEDDEPPKV